MFTRILAATAVVVQISMPITAQAAAADYILALAETTYPFGSNAVLEVLLIDVRTGRPVDGAILFATRLDMAPEGMEAMTSPVATLPADAPGQYRFTTDLTMEGNWQFSVAAKVQGEAETVQARFLIEVQP
ncbi:FixH family protein [uncultured Jannaschia sp.]|uniref:FixH family protein n=1 Tax=uncultured Jannaschia sp. TaxID=293347 RepID=UPI00261593FC|nr:FixH family protein [uncultured Jannaschia sp.]